MLFCAILSLTVLTLMLYSYACDQQQQRTAADLVARIKRLQKASSDAWQDYKTAEIQKREQAAKNLYVHWRTIAESLHSCCAEAHRAGIEL